DVEQHLSRDISYTAIRAMLARLTKRGVIERRGVGRPQSFVYFIRGDNDESARNALRKAVKEHFGGSTLSAGLAMLELLNTEGTASIVATALTQASQRLVEEVGQETS